MLSIEIENFENRFHGGHIEIISKLELTSGQFVIMLLKEIGKLKITSGHIGLCYI